VLEFEYGVLCGLNYCSVQFFTVKPDSGVVAKSFKEGDKVYINPEKLLPLSRFTNESSGGGKGKGKGNLLLCASVLSCVFADVTFFFFQARVRAKAKAKAKAKARVRAREKERAKARARARVLRGPHGNCWSLANLGLHGGRRIMDLGDARAIFRADENSLHCCQWPELSKGRNASKKKQKTHSSACHALRMCWLCAL
jgi:hypothetical protein